MDEGRKRIGNLAWDGRGGNPACESLVMSALGLAERIMEVIDRKYAVKERK